MFEKQGGTHCAGSTEEEVERGEVREGLGLRGLMSAAGTFAPSESGSHGRVLSRGAN